jgi:NAD(P)-dependent dehydrogenase (short-subunit alcohol dehydrogenase family)
LAERNATAAVVGAGDFIGAAIAKKFAAEGFTIFAGRRNADKLAPLVNDIETAGGKVVARGLDARKEEDITAFLRAADAHAPLEVCIFNVGGNVNFPLLDTTGGTREPPCPSCACSSPAPGRSPPSRRGRPAPPRGPPFPPDAPHALHVAVHAFFALGHWASSASARLAMLAAMRRAASRVSSLAAASQAGLSLKVDVGPALRSPAIKPASVLWTDQDGGKRHSGMAPE